LERAECVEWVSNSDASLDTALNVIAVVMDEATYEKESKSEKEVEGWADGTLHFVSGR
jgi:hypothetical protein